MNNALYWRGGSQQQPYNPYGYGYGGYPQQQCQQPQFVQQCQYGCSGNQCAQNPQQQNLAGKQPIANLTCGDADSVDVGDSVQFKFTCTNAVSSKGSGFSTDNQLSGTASTTVRKPPAKTDTVSYGLTCTAETGQTASDKCDVKINVTSIILVANPKEVDSGVKSTIGWVNKGMDACVIWSPDADNDSKLQEFNEDNDGNTNVNGVADTPPLTKDTEFVLSCVTKTGKDKEASVKVKVKN